ncbi:GDSL lipase acylhydrolase family [Cordyceps militaris]|uniref:GDSL lipase acylhydrolase family n=1 Tax=Cordyceps militaris TaxID=73501 RepID=A0A2H4SPP8_CORMI|nr:GDSL lipase acylhydrolase family [Cordyceps militaris]
MNSVFRCMALSTAICMTLASGAGTGTMDNLVTFGDSYTDESRAIYLAKHGQMPPPGLLMPPNNITADGGISWGRMVASVTGARYYNYAVAGSTCSQKVATQPARIIPGQAPTVLEYGIPAFEADLACPSFYVDRQPNNTVYAMWIGTNDLGVEGFLYDRNMPGTILADLVDCIWKSFDHIYRTGGRRFIVMNTVPLDKAPTYASFGSGGAGDNPVWPTKSKYNTTEYQHKMFQYSRAVNELLDNTSPVHLLVKRRWPGASITVFDAHSIFNDIHENPGKYLSPPQNVVSSFKTCDAGGNCENSSLSRSSFLWYVHAISLHIDQNLTYSRYFTVIRYDMLHPSERTMEIVAEEFVLAVKGASKYATVYQSQV